MYEVMKRTGVLIISEILIVVWLVALHKFSVQMLLIISAFVCVVLAYFDKEKRMGKKKIYHIAFYMCCIGALLIIVGCIARKNDGLIIVGAILFSSCGVPVFAVDLLDFLRDK